MSIQVIYFQENLCPVGLDNDLEVERKKFEQNVLKFFSLHEFSISINEVENLK